MIPWLLAALMLFPAVGPSGNTKRNRQPDLESLYRARATAVVYVRGTYKVGTTTTVSSGAGVILEDGRVLTACHTLRHGDDDELDVDSVEIIVGELDAKSGAVRAGIAMPAKMIRCDRQRDLALVRTVNTLSVNKPAKIARRDPPPGRSVAALGPSWMGFAWSIRGCTVNGIGVPNKDSTELVSAVSSAAVERKRKRLEKNVLIHAGCSDHPLSGSPLLAADGRVVGMLQFTRWDKGKGKGKGKGVGREWHFYIAASEIRAFLAE